jgi:hypothetical protein
VLDILEAQIRLPLINQKNSLTYKNWFSARRI